MSERLKAAHDKLPDAVTDLVSGADWKQVKATT